LSRPPIGHVRLVVIAALVGVLLASGAVADDLILARADYPEGPLWYRQKLYYGEMMRDRVVISHDLKTTATFWERPGCGPVSVAPYGEKELLVLCHLLHVVVRVSLSGATLAVISRDDAGLSLVHPNGSCADGKGGVYFTASGFFSPSASATGAVMHLERGGKLRRLAERIHYANGIAVDTARRRLFVSEHLARRVLAFPVHEDGTLGTPSVFFDLNKLPPTGDLDPLAGPDGLELEGAGRLLVAEYGAGRIHHVGADGTWLGTLSGLKKYVTDMTLLPDGRAAITQSESNSVPPYAGNVMLLEKFLSRLKR
jgi:sugar lactone lactonase YvrE